MLRYRFSLMAFLGILFLIPLPSLAQTPCDPRQESCIGKPCIGMGATIIDKGGQNIIACLPRGDLKAGSPDQRPLYWKQSSIDDVDCGEGQTLRGISSNGTPVCVPASSGSGAVFSMFVMRTSAECMDVPLPTTAEATLPFPPPPFPPDPSAPYYCHVSNYITGNCSCPSGTRAIGLGWFAGPSRAKIQEAPPSLANTDKNDFVHPLYCMIPYLCEPN